MDKQVQIHHSLNMKTECKIANVSNIMVGGSKAGEKNEITQQHNLFIDKKKSKKIDKNSI